MDPLKEEMERGRVAAEALVEHVANMRAAEYEQTGEFEGISYRVTAERLPHPSDFEEPTKQPRGPDEL